VVLRSFSKAYGLAGLRVGMAVGDTELIAWLDRVRLPFNVGVMAQRAALAALEDAAFMRRGVAAVNRNREFLAAGLRRLKMSATDSAANFLFVQSPIAGHKLFSRMLKSGIIIRALDEYGLPDHVRITVGSAEQNKALLAALRRVLESERP
jgi:histidinol-phosphate aminotransferase